MQNTVTRKVFGQIISYNLVIQENRANNQYDIRVECLQPKLLVNMLGNSPELFRKQLIQVATDAAYNFDLQAQFEEPAFVASSEKEVSIRARFSCR